MKIMLLNDSETFTDLAGCRIVYFRDGTTPEEIEAGLKDGAGECHFAFTGDEPGDSDALSAVVGAAADIARENGDQALASSIRHACHVWDIESPLPKEEP